MFSNKWLLALLAFLMFFCSGCANTLLQVTATHVRTYKVSESTPLPAGDGVESVELQKQLDIDVIKMVEGAYSLVEKVFTTVFDLGGALLKGVGILVVEGPPAPETVKG